MRQHTAVIALFLFGGVFLLGLLALASMLGSGVSQAEAQTCLDADLSDPFNLDDDSNHDAC